MAVEELFFSSWAYMGLVAFIVACSAVVFYYWRAHSAPSPGIVLGFYELKFRHAGGRLLHKEIKGVVVDATGLFCSQEVSRIFVELVCKNIDKLLARLQPQLQNPNNPATHEKLETPPMQTNEINLLQTLKANLKKFDFSSVCRVLIVRDGALFGDRHLIVQLCDPKRTLSDYATHEEESHFSLSLGPVNQGLVTGTAAKLPGFFVFPNKRFPLGKMAGYIFRPDDPLSSTVSQKGLADLEHADTIAFGQVIGLMPTTVHSTEHIKSLEQSNKDKDFELEKMGNQLAGLRAFADALLRGTKGFSTESGEKSLQDYLPKRIDAIDFVCLLSIPTLMSGSAYGLFGGNPVSMLVGMVTGLSIVGFIISRRH